MPRPSNVLPPNRDVRHVVFSRSLLVRCTQQRFPPRQSPWAPTLLESCETECDFPRAALERGRRGVLATANTDHGPSESMVSGNQVDREVLEIRGQVLKGGIRLSDRKRAELV